MMHRAGPCRHPMAQPRPTCIPFLPHPAPAPLCLGAAPAPSPRAHQFFLLPAPERPSDGVKADTAARIASSATTTLDTG